MYRNGVVYLVLIYACLSCEKCKCHNCVGLAAKYVTLSKYKRTYIAVYILLHYMYYVRTQMRPYFIRNIRSMLFFRFYNLMALFIKLRNFHTKINIALLSDLDLVLNAKPQ